MGDPKDLHVSEKVCFKKVAKIMESCRISDQRHQDVGMAKHHGKFLKCQDAFERQQ